MPARQPQQDRSRRTRDKILAATEALLRQKTFEQVTVSAIVRRAGATVGSFYNLFDDKDALLPHLYQRHAAAMEAAVAALEQRVAARRRGLVPVVRDVVAAIVALHQQQHGLLRALVLRGQTQPQARRAERPPEMDALVPRIAALVAIHRTEIRHPQPARAAAVGLVAVLAMAREYLLFPQTTAYAVPLPDHALPRELTRLYLRYLGVDA
ncbi:MAG: helix-turn-helix domain-containing protein [Planctomycetota bacterium]